MLILLVCSSYGGGGAERVAANLADYLVANGITVCIYYWNNKDSESYSLAPGIELCQSPGSSLFSRINGLRTLLKSRQFDAIISFTDIANIIAYLASTGLRSSINYMPTIHSNLKARDLHQKKSLYLGLIKLLHKKACQSSKNVIVVSDGARNELIHYYHLPSDNVFRIYNPVFHTSANCAMRTIPPHNILKLVAAGRLTQAKNYTLMLHAISLLKHSFNTHVHLTIYGEGELRPEIESTIQQLELGNDVELKGFVPDLSEQLGRYDIFVLSSSWEGFGNVLVEALAAGLHVVSTDCPSGPAEVLAHGKYGKLVALDNPRQMAQAILDIAQNPPAFTETDLAAHLQQFSIEHIGRQYLELIRCGQ